MNFHQIMRSTPGWEPFSNFWIPPGSAYATTMDGVQFVVHEAFTSPEMDRTHLVLEAKAGELSLNLSGISSAHDMLDLLPGLAALVKSTLDKTRN